MIIQQVKKINKTADISVVIYIGVLMRVCCPYSSWSSADCAEPKLNIGYRLYSLIAALHVDRHDRVEEAVLRSSLYLQNSLQPN
jgi:hypothetical protein